MKLTRPINFLDIESTGLDAAKDRIVSLAMVQRTPPVVLAQEYLGSGPWTVQESRHEWLFNPGFAMSEEVMAVHGITNEMVANAPPFVAQARNVYALLKDADVAGFNVNFDLGLLWEELHRAGIEWDLEGTAVVDASVIFKRKEERTLSAAVEFYYRKRHGGAHTAMGDVRATMAVLRRQLGDFKGELEGEALLSNAGFEPSRYHDLREMDVAALSAYCATDKDGSRRADLAGTIRVTKEGEFVYGTKRNKDVRVLDDRGYAQWILRSDFPEQTKAVVRRVLKDACNPKTHPNGQTRNLL